MDAPICWRSVAFVPGVHRIDCIWAVYTAFAIRTLPCLDSMGGVWYYTLMSTQYVTDDKGKKTAVLLPIEKYEKLLEDLEDLAAIAERRSEPTISHDELIEELKRDGLLPA